MARLPVPVSHGNMHLPAESQRVLEAAMLLTTQGGKPVDMLEAGMWANPQKPPNQGRSPQGRFRPELKHV